MNKAFNMQQVYQELENKDNQEYPHEVISRLWIQGLKKWYVTYEKRFNEDTDPYHIKNLASSKNKIIKNIEELKEFMKENNLQRKDIEIKSSCKSHIYWKVISKIFEEFN